MRDYEMVVLLHPDLEIDLDTPLKKVAGIITKNGGKVVKQDNWGKRKLAYTIKHEEFAVYVYFEIQLPPESYQKVESTLNITKEVLRYLITHPVPKPEVTEEDEAKKDEDEKEVKDEQKEPEDDTTKSEDKDEE